MPERILIGVDDGARRRLFGAALETLAGVELVGSGPAGEGTLRMAAARRPDIVLLEAARPAVEGAKLVARLREVAPWAGVIALVSGEDRPRSFAARALRPDRYVDPDVATAALRDVVAEFARERRRDIAAS